MKERRERSPREVLSITKLTSLSFGSRQRHPRAVPKRPRSSRLGEERPVPAMYHARFLPARRARRLAEEAHSEWRAGQASALDRVPPGLAIVRPVRWLHTIDALGLR